MHKIFNYLSIVVLCLFIPSFSFAQNSLFPVEGNIRTRVEFWKKVYTQISTNEAFIHDSNDLSIIYKKVKLPSSRRARKRLIKNQKRKLKKILRAIARNKTKDLSAEGQKILGIVLDKSSKQLFKMANNIRFQYGLRDRYYQGLIRSYKYLDFIQKTYADMGLPIELSYLPHVESSFNYKAYSKVGAAGIWQFMRSTGRMYGLKVNYIIDERRDPIKATKAAARLLRDNFKKLNSWPLALTAYNHGARSMVRAIKKLRTTSIDTIVEKYKGRRFGFASKNFYATFMATVEISKNPEKYFDTLKKPKIHKFSEIKLTRSYTIPQLKRALNLTNKELKEYNIEIRPIAYRSPLYLPKGITIKLPATNSNKLSMLRTKLKRLKRHSPKSYIEHMHIVSRRETLFDISRIYKVNMNKIIAYNNIDNPSRIFPGMKLKIPGNKTKFPTKKIIKNIKKPAKFATISQGNRRDKEIFNFDGDLFFKTFGKVLKKSKLQKKINVPMVLPEINLNSYHLDLTKLAKDRYIITIDNEETLGHYADWGLVRVQRIRKVNRMNFRTKIIPGNEIILPVKDHLINRFKEKRNEYHLSIQEDFFSHYKIIDSKIYNVKKGDTLSSILNKENLPFWLVRQYQKDGKISLNLKVGQKIQLPILESVTDETSELPTDVTED